MSDFLLTFGAMHCPTPPESCRPSCATSSTSPERSFAPVCSMSVIRRPSGAPTAASRAPRARLARCTCARARFRPPGSAQRRAIGPRAARVPARARAPASLSSASTNPPALAAKAARRRRAAQRRKFWRRGLKLGHFSRPLGRRREQHGALEAPCPAGAFAPGLGGRAAFLLADCGGSEATADSARNGQLG